MGERGNPLLRFADGVAGPPLLRAIWAFRRKKGLPEAPRRIGLLCFGAIGDLLLLSAVGPDLQAAYPEAEIIFIGSETNKSIAPILPLKSFVTLPIKRPDKALKGLRALKLDVLIDSTQWAKLPALLSAQSGAMCIGFKTEGQHRHFAYDMQVEHRNDRHEIENFRDLAGQIAPMSDRRPELVLTDDDRAHVAQLGLGRYGVLHAWPSGLRSELKEWPVRHWVELAKAMHARGLSVVLTGAPQDVQKTAALAEAIGSHPWLHDLSGRLKLSQTAALLGQAAATVSVNTSIMHLMATFDRPLIALSGPTNPLRWGPLSDFADNPKPQCDGCWYLNLGFEYPQDPADCMAAIPVEAVLAALDARL